MRVNKEKGRNRVRGKQDKWLQKRDCRLKIDMTYSLSRLVLIEILRRVPYSTKKHCQGLILQRFRRFLTDYLTANKEESFCIFSFLSSIDGCTYRFMVILTLACPNISLRLFISNPTSIQRVANVCRSA